MISMAQGSNWSSASRKRCRSRPAPPLVWGDKSDLDSYIQDFAQDHRAAWDGVKALIADRQPYGRLYAGTGEEFFDFPVHGSKPVFTPKLLGDALLARQTYRYTASQLWVYRHGVYGGEGRRYYRPMPKSC